MIGVGTIGCSVEAEARFGYSSSASAGRGVEWTCSFWGELCTGVDGEGGAVAEEYTMALYRRLAIKYALFLCSHFGL
jgi:hypothetical protein